MRYGAKSSAGASNCEYPELLRHGSCPAPAPASKDSLDSAILAVPGTAAEI